MKYILLLLTLLIFPVAVSAGDFYLNLNLTSLHDHQYWNGEKMNQENLGTGIEYDLSSNQKLFGGGYFNSMRHPTYYALYGYTPLHFLGGDLGAIAGISTGYNYLFNGHRINPNPTAGFVYAWKNSNKDYGINLFYVPTIKSANVDGFLGIQVAYRL